MFVDTKYKLSKLLRISSTDALPGSVSKSDFMVDLGNNDATEKCTNIGLKSCIFCNCFYNVNENNQNFTFLDDVTTRTVIIPIGQYTTTTYIAALKAAIDAVLTSGSVAITQSTVNSKLTFVFTGTSGDVTLYPKASNPGGNLVGITSDLIANAGNTYTVTAQAMPRFYGLTEVFVEINEVFPTLLLDPSTAVRNVGANIPITAPFGALNHYEASNSQMAMFTYPSRRNFRTVHVRLIDRSGNVVDLQNNNLRLMLKSYYETY